MDDFDGFGESLETIRKAKGLSQLELANKSGVKQTSISAYERGTRKPGIVAVVKLARSLGCNVSELFGDDCSIPEISMADDLSGALRQQMSLTRVPILGSAAAAGFHPAVEPIDDYVVGCGDEYAMWDGKVKDSYFSLRVDGDSMSPQFPNGTLLLVGAGEFPQRGDIVVARLSDHGEVICKQYFRKNGVIELRSRNHGGKSYTVDIKAEPGRVVWIYPVLQAKIDLRQQRWETHKNGEEIL